jgi:hypothetical protein
MHDELKRNLKEAIIRQIKSRGMRWAGLVARMGVDSVQGFAGKARRKGTTRKTEAQTRGWDHN